MTTDSTDAISTDAGRRGEAAASAVMIAGIEAVNVDPNRQPSLSLRWWWNTGVQFILNPTLGILRVLNQETQDVVSVGSAGAGLVHWFLPWCNDYNEVANKALDFRLLLPGETGRGTRLFSVFQDYRSDTAMWLPAGVTDFAAREPVEMVAGSGAFVVPASLINLKITVVQPGNRILPAADIVVP